jgi:hypothetical protein
MRNVVKGFTRKGSAVVNADDAQLKIIKQQREVKKSRDRMEAEIARLRVQVEALTARVLALESR